MSLMDVLPIVLSSLALLVSVVVAVRTDRRATRAERTALEAATSALWSDAIEATLRVMSNPKEEGSGERFQTLGVRFTALVDALQDWDGLDKWLSAETMFGAALRRQVGEAFDKDPTEEKVTAALELYADWGHALSQNLRHFRNTGYDARTLKRLREAADTHAKTIRKRHGWPDPPGATNVQRLDD